MPPLESSFNLSAVSEFVLDSTPMLWRSTLPYLSEEYPIKGLLISSSRKFGISPMIWLLIRFFAPGRLKGPRLWRMPGGPPPFISGLLRSWLALGAFLVRLDVTLIMSTWSGSTGGPAIIFGSKKSSPSSSSSSHPACEAGGGGILGPGPGPLRRMLNSCSLKAISFCRRASSLSRKAISGPPGMSYPPSAICATWPSGRLS
jgi:hypothetical protein